MGICSIVDYVLEEKGLQKDNEEGIKLILSNSQLILGLIFSSFQSIVWRERMSKRTEQADEMIKAGCRNEQSRLSKRTEQAVETNRARCRNEQSRLSKQTKQAVETS